MFLQKNYIYISPNLICNKNGPSGNPPHFIHVRFHPLNNFDTKKTQITYKYVFIENKTLKTAIRHDLTWISYLSFISLILEIIPHNLPKCLKLVIFSLHFPIKCYCNSPSKAASTEVVMAHRLSLRKRRSTTTAIFLLPFCENAFFMKESPPQMSPPASQFALQHDRYV